MPTGLVLDPIFETHLTGPGHPERPARLAALRAALDAAGLTPRCTRIAPRAAGDAELTLVHDAAYVRRVEAACAAGAPFIDTPDSAICPASAQVARLAAGAVIDAALAAARGELRRAFCAVRPPGHHAERARSMGFCLFNNVALAGAALLAQGLAQRVLILDWDVHHGNGTQHAFEADRRVLFVSLHGHPAYLYPGSGFAEETGVGPGAGFTLNVPLPPRTGDAAYRAAFETLVLPRVRAFAPDFVLISAGFDAHQADPLGNLALPAETFDWLLRQSLDLAAAHGGGRLVSVLEGGYDLPALSAAGAAHLRMLLEA